MGTSSFLDRLDAFFEAGGYRLRDRTKVLIDSFMEGDLRHGAVDHPNMGIVVGRKVNDDLWQLNLINRDEEKVLVQIDHKDEKLRVSEPNDAITRTILNYVLTINKKQLKYHLTTDLLESKMNESKVFGMIAKLNIPFLNK